MIPQLNVYKKAAVPRINTARDTTLRHCRLRRTVYHTDRTARVYSPSSDTDIGTSPQILPATDTITEYICTEYHLANPSACLAANCPAAAAARSARPAAAIALSGLLFTVLSICPSPGGFASSYKSLS